MIIACAWIKNTYWFLFYVYSLKYSKYFYKNVYLEDEYKLFLNTYLVFQKLMQILFKLSGRLETLWAYWSKLNYLEIVLCSYNTIGMLYI